MPCLMVDLEVGSFVYENVSQIRVGNDDSLSFVCPDEGVPSTVKLEADEWDTITLVKRAI